MLKIPQPTPSQPLSTDAQLSPLATANLDRVKKEIAKPGSVVCLAKCVEMVKILTDEKNPASVDEITEAILKDTFLTTRVLTVANSAYYNRSGKTISTVSQAILILGLSQIRSIVFSVLVVEQLPDQERARNIRNRTVSAAFGGSVAKNLSEQLSLRIPETAFMAGAFSQFGKLLVYSFLNDLATQYDQAVAQGADETAAAEQFFGLRIEALGKMIGQHLGLPPSLVAHMDPHDLSSAIPPEEAHLRQLSRASSEVCRISERSTDPEDVRQKLLASDLFRHGSLSKVDLGAMFEASVRCIEEVYTAAAGAPLFQKLKTISKNFAPTAPQPQQLHTQLRPTQMIEVLRDGLSTVTNRVGDSSATVRSVLSLVCETFFFALSARNVVAALRNQNKNALAGEYGIGENAETIKNKFHVSLAQNTPQLTSVALMTNKDIYVDKAGISKFTANLPPWILEQKPETLILVPIVANHTRYGLIYADGPCLLPNGKLDKEAADEIERLKSFIVWMLAKSGRD